MDLSSVSELLRAAAGVLVSVVANLVYFDLRRRGRRGWTRFFSFWLGTPVTWLTFFVLKEGSQPALEPPADDEEALLREIREDRALRAGPGEPPPHEASSGPPSAT